MRRTALALALLLATAGAAEAHTLTHSKAKAAAQRKGDSVAKTRTRVKSVLRTTQHRYYAQAEWTRTNLTGCKGCGFDPVTGLTYDTATTEHCFVDMNIRFRSRRSSRLVVRVQSTACF